MTVVVRSLCLVQTEPLSESSPIVANFFSLHDIVKLRVKEQFTWCDSVTVLCELLLINIAQLDYYTKSNEIN